MSGTPERTRYCSRCLTTFPADAQKCPNLGCRSARPASGWGELLEADEVIDRTYRIHARLAIGGAGVTYLGGELGADGTAEVGPRVAIKVLYQQRDQGSYLRRLSTEAQILQGMNHPQIVECRGFVHRSGHSPYLVTRYEEGGSLLDHIRRVGTLSIPVVAGIGRQVCWALDVAHRQGVVHRDLKPENVLLVREVPAEQIPEIRVADFGIAKVFGGVGDRLTRVGAFVGTPQYAAPEQFDGLTPEPATDVYAVGALLYFCISARPVADLMAELDPDSQKDHLVRHLPVRLEPEHGTPELRRWMEETLAVAMAVDPGDRCDVSQLESRLASIQVGRDPGFIRLPPAGSIVPGSRTIQGSGPTHTADTLDSAFVSPLITDEGTLGGPPPIPPRLPPPVPPMVPPPVPPSFTSASVSEGPGSDRTVPIAGPAAPMSKPAAHRTPSATPSGHGASDPQRQPARSSAAPIGCSLLAAGGLGGALVVAAILAWVFLPPSARELTAAETNPDDAADWLLVAGTLGEKGVAAEVACASPGYLAIRVVIEADGAVRGAELLNYPHEPTRACIEAELKKTHFPRKGKGPIQVAVSLTK
ncbi:MAG: serine/threonine-protein kinase [Pseudomonadota bacterium]|nr:serine/threonine-protein kinase [Pseudomonadota bacterium]